jgi:hypothetical protein
VKTHEQDPRRWADRSDGPAIEDQIGASFRKMGDPPLPDDTVLARVERTLLAPSPRRRRLGPLAVAAGIALAFVGGVVSAHRGSFPFSPEPVSAIGQLSVPGGSTVRMGGKRQRKIALVGPAEVTFGEGNGNTDSIALRQGLLAVEAGLQPLAVAVDGFTVTVSAGSAGAVSATGRGEPEAIAIAGTVEVTAAGSRTIVGERHSWRGGVTGLAPSDRLGDVGRALYQTISTPAPSPALAIPPAPVPKVDDATPGRPPPASRLALRGSGRAAAAASGAATPVPPPVPPPGPPPAPPASPPPETDATHLPPPFAVPAPGPLPVPALAPPLITQTNAPDAEIALIANAVRRLRTEGDPGGALAALDQYRSRFPAGTLAREATLARVETLLALDRRDEALRVLDTAAIGNLPRARAVRATRGELRAEMGRCTDAVKDFELLLTASQRDEYAERALYGRAACRARAADTIRARADLTLYQALFPEGRFAAEVQRLLADR